MVSVGVKVCAILLGVFGLLNSSPQQIPGAVPHGAVVAGSAARGDAGIGIHANPDAGDAPPAAVFGVERLWDTGAIWCRMNPEPGLWDFAPLTQQLDAAAMRGAQSAIVVLGFAPPHAVSGAPNPREAAWLCPRPGYASRLPDDAVWDDYVTRTVSAVRGWQVAHPEVAVHFQVWNEPAVRWFLAPDQTPARLMELAVLARRIITAAMPGSLLLSPPMVASGTPRKARWQRAFVAEAARQPVFDVWAVHLYPAGASGPAVWADYVWARDDALAMIAAGRAPNDRVWVTEINANIAFDAAPTSVLSDADQAAFVQAVSADLAARGVPVVVWYRWHYDPWLAGSGQIVFAQDSVALAALR